MLSSELTTMIIFREHEINSHIGSGYDLWRDDNVTRDGEGLYRFHWEYHHSGGNALIINWLKSLKHFPVGGGDESASCFSGGKLFKALVRFEHFIFINVMHTIYISLDWIGFWISYMIWEQPHWQISFSGMFNSPSLRSTHLIKHLKSSSVFTLRWWSSRWSQWSVWFKSWVFPPIWKKWMILRRMLNCKRGSPHFVFTLKFANGTLSKFGWMKIRLRSAHECKHLQR